MRTHICSKLVHIFHKIFQLLFSASSLLLFFLQLLFQIRYFTSICSPHRISISMTRNILETFFEFRHHLITQQFFFVGTLMRKAFFLELGWDLQVELHLTNTVWELWFWSSYSPWQGMRSSMNPTFHYALQFHNIWTLWQTCTCFNSCRSICLSLSNCSLSLRIASSISLAVSDICFFAPNSRWTPLRCTCWNSYSMQILCNKEKNIIWMTWHVISIIALQYIHRVVLQYLQSSFIQVSELKHI